jgi:hypothetical protein
MSKTRTAKRAVPSARAKKAGGSTRAKRTPKKATKKESPIEIPMSFAAVAAAFAKDRQVSLQRGWGPDNVVLKLDRKIFVMFARGDLVAKLPKQRVDELIGAGQGIRFDPRRDGRLMKEWLVVRPSAPNWIELAVEAHAFAKKGKA